MVRQDLEEVVRGTTGEVPRRAGVRAVRLYRESGPKRVIAHLAHWLGVRPEALRNWIRLEETDRGKRGDRPATTESEELRRMRRQNAEFKRASGILKGASAFSQRDPTRPGGGCATGRPV